MNSGKDSSQLHYMRRIAVDAFDVFIEGLVETKMRVKEAVANICQANCKEGCKTFSVSP